MRKEGRRRKQKAQMRLREGSGNTNRRRKHPMSHALHKAYLMHRRRRDLKILLPKI